MCVMLALFSRSPGVCVRAMVSDLALFSRPPGVCAEQ